MSDGFTLIGHSSPLGKYPAPVVPVGRLNDELVAVYAGSDAPDVVPIAEDCSFIHHDARLQKALSEFDYGTHRLFAVDEDRVMAYPASEEEEFFIKLLKDTGFSQQNPFLRLSLAKATRKAFAINRELPACVNQIAERTPHYVNMWIDEEKAAIGKRITPYEAAAVNKILDSLRQTILRPENDRALPEQLVSVTMKELLEAGVHFGHQVRRWNPRMKEYIFGERNGIYIIDLQKSQRLFREAIQFVTKMMVEDPTRTVLFVGTKRQAQESIREEAERCGQFYINRRWLGGLLTNFVTVQRSIKRLNELESFQADPRYEMLTKKERIKLDRERESLNKNLHGIRRLNRVPDALFVIDVGKEEIAVREANRLGIPVIGVVDTNWSPEGVDFVIPGNDDALRAVRLFSSRIADAILAGQQFARGGELPVAATSRSMAATQAIDHRGMDEAHLELVADEASVGVASEPTDLLIEMPYARN